jgi:16S rRNA (cytidine1402-2'-O)-methyltransferase
MEDITVRVLKILRKADIIAAEDTRRTVKLLNKYKIKTKLTSYREHNKRAKGPELLALLQSGAEIALVTDAGMPGISDPGADLIRLCAENGIEITTVPGPSALISALVLSGLDASRFAFEGFFDKKILNELKNEPRTMIFYESPHRVLKTLKILLENFGDRKISVCRELTKKFEEVYRNSISEAILYFGAKEIKGEIVLTVEGKKSKKSNQNGIDADLDFDLKSCLNQYLERGFSKNEAIKLIAKDCKTPKRKIYKKLIDV